LIHIKIYSGVAQFSLRSCYSCDNLVKLSYRKHKKGDRDVYFWDRCICLWPSYWQSTSLLHCTKKTARLSPLLV